MTILKLTTENIKVETLEIKKKKAKLFFYF